VSDASVTIELISSSGEVSCFDVKPGGVISLLELFEDSGVRSPFGCRVGTCGTCVVRVLEGLDLLEDPLQMEEDTLARISETEGAPLRLACRATLKDGARGRLRLEKLLIR
jgi:ferredoxin